ncbi:23S rRNA m(5)U-1939 methyltransferase [Magnetococcus marinus MC-1]|uniref:23S rRNA m(5)U-1939 methyltransferase n=1 Tax=Magnetococcus marinus (strain ATCC BAA-1437 / JCM 17883 / MC-1) TaxID=156889 RepID=A0LDR0_MAGMM|nr:23S rRNA (uracil(1939)-C(5))-methyltransferase RlmD [Magnetococcus marinus]ABK46103.1 23S rRNA m(5)U-1939 methyltransferase [Magnetococcus marinus MC-1]
MQITIDKLASGGSGLGFHDGMAIFVPNTAPGDLVEIEIKTKRKRHAHAELIKIIQASPNRCEPICPVYHQCGGCQLQHVNQTTRNTFKAAVVKEALQHIGKFENPPMQPLQSAQPETGYRRRCGLKIYWVRDHAVVGFYQTASKRIVDLPNCPILHPKLDALIHPIRTLVSELSVRERLPQVDLSCGDEGVGMILHLLRKLSAKDKEILTTFAHTHKIDQLWIQSGRKEDLTPFISQEPLRYSPDGKSQLKFMPGDFTQAHFEQNRQLVEQVLAWIGQGQRVLDLFSGLGNFTLPLARQFTRVTGYESYEPAVKRGRSNTTLHPSVTFKTMDLFSETALKTLPLNQVDAMVVDPPRDGAVNLAKQIKDAGGPATIVWVSCDPATFARDAAILCAGGYTMEQVKPLDMFPMTSHVEVVALFKRPS